MKDDFMREKRESKLLQAVYLKFKASFKMPIIFLFGSDANVFFYLYFQLEL